MQQELVTRIQEHLAAQKEIEAAKEAEAAAAKQAKLEEAAAARAAAAAQGACGSIDWLLGLTATSQQLQRKTPRR